MILEIDTRIFNFIKDENFRITIDSFLWFYKDNIRITNTKSLMIIPYRNKVDKIGLEYKTLKDRLINQGSIISLEVSDIECPIEEEYEDGVFINSKFVKCSFGSNTFLCRKFENNMSHIIMENETMEFKHKVIVPPKIFKNLVYKNAGFLINGNKIEVVDLEIYNGDFSKILYLTIWEKFNGLDRNKEFTLYYNDLGKAGDIYKAVQGDITLFELGAIYE